MNATSNPQDLPTSAYIVLGMIGLGVRSGYEIKRTVDESTRHFSALSFRQIYPELKRMEEAGLVVGSDADTGDRPRRFYELTDAGEHLLDAWLRADDEVSTELRHSGLMKLFFADRLAVDERRALIDRIREHHRRSLRALQTSRSAATAREAAHDQHFPRITLDFGIELSSFVIDWCDRLQQSIADQPERLRRRVVPG